MAGGQRSGVVSNVCVLTCMAAQPQCSLRKTAADAKSTWMCKPTRLCITVTLFKFLNKVKLFFVFSDATRCIRWASGLFQYIFFCCFLFFAQAADASAATDDYRSVTGAVRACRSGSEASGHVPATCSSCLCIGKSVLCNVSEVIYEASLVLGCCTSQPHSSSLTGRREGKTNDL